MCSTKNLTNNDIHYNEGLSLYLYGFKQYCFQSPQKNVAAKFIEYCCNIICYNIMKAFKGHHKEA